MSDSARKGKIARLPLSLREQINARLLDGQPGTTLLAWLNALPEVKTLMREHFAAEPISDQNLTAWRQGGYQDWLAKQEEVARAQALSEFASRMVSATGVNLSDAAAAIAAGHILERIQDANPEETLVLLDAIRDLRKGDHTLARLDLDRTKAALKAREVKVAEDRLRYVTAEKFLEWAATSEAQSILNSNKSKTVKLKEIQALLWGEDEQ